MIDAKYKSNLNNFLLKFSNNKEKALKEMGKTGVDSINSETPVLSGNLKKENGFNISNDILYFYNNANYSAYVNLGTMFQAANPFFSRGITKAVPAMTSTLVKNLRV